MYRIIPTWHLIHNHSLALAMEKQVDSDKLVETTSTLSHRIGERFPNNGIHHTSIQLLKIAHQARRRTREIDRPILWIKAVTLFLAALIVCVVFGAIWGMIASPIDHYGFFDFIHHFQIIISDIIYIALALIFLMTMETRVKRKRSVDAFHELRNLAHVIDTLQIDKSPAMLFSSEHRTKSSPSYDMSRFELSRYLDYCSEMLSVVSKIASLYVQEFHDHVALSIVNEIESLCANLSSKIWQKSIIIMLIEDFGTGELKENV